MNQTKTHKSKKKTKNKTLKTTHIKKLILKQQHKKNNNTIKTKQTKTNKQNDKIQIDH